MQQYHVTLASLFGGVSHACVWCVCRRGNRFDRARGYEIGNKDFELEYIEEAFTSQNWIVRIYKVKDADNRPQL